MKEPCLRNIICHVLPQFMYNSLLTGMVCFAGYKDFVGPARELWGRISGSRDICTIK